MRTLLKLHNINPSPDMELEFDERLNRIEPYAK